MGRWESEGVKGGCGEQYYIPTQISSTHSTIVSQTHTILLKHYTHNCLTFCSLTQVCIKVYASSYYTVHGFPRLSKDALVFGRAFESMTLSTLKAVSYEVEKSRENCIHVCMCLYYVASCD